MGFRYPQRSRDASYNNATSGLTARNAQDALDELKVAIDGVAAGLLTDGDKGDITISGGGTVWNIDAGVVTTTELGGDITTAGKALLDDASASAQRTTLGLGTIATQSGAWSTFTPTVTLVGGSGNTVPVYTINSGRWCQIGKIVYCSVLLQGDGGAEGAGTGHINIALPVAAGTNILGPYSHGPMGYFQDGAVSTVPYLLFGSFTGGASTVALYKYLPTSYTIATGANQGNTTRSIVANFHYEVD